MSVGLKGALFFFFQFQAKKGVQITLNSQSCLFVSHAHHVFCPPFAFNIFSRRRMFLKKSSSFIALSSGRHSSFFSNFYLYSRRCKLTRMQTHRPKLLICDSLWFLVSAEVALSGMPGQLSPWKHSTAYSKSERELMCVHFGTENRLSEITHSSCRSAKIFSLTREDISNSCFLSKVVKVGFHYA